MLSWRPATRFVSALASAVLLTGCAASAVTDTTDHVADAEQPPAEGPAPAPTLTPTVAWEPCEAPFECATVPVPLDHHDPAAETIELALIRLPAPPAARRIGSLVINPGGPGSSGVEFVRARSVQVIPAELRARFDIVGFDPRGVGASRPITCHGGSSAFLSQDLAPDDADETAAVLAAAEAYAASCGDASADLLAHVGTANVARDLDAIRVALGDAELTYLGYSYGTRIGAAYAELFPENVRALVLDGAVDPTLDLTDQVSAQAGALEAALSEFLATCASDEHCPLPAERSTLAAFDALMADLDARGLPAPELGGRLEAGQAAVAVLALLRDRPRWPLLAAALALAWEGNGSLLAVPLAPVASDGDALADELSSLMAVNCLDVPAPPPGKLPALAADLAASAPRFGPVTLFLHAPCAFWPVAAEGTPREIAAPGTPPIVVVGNRGDLITPFGWSESLVAQLDSGVLLTRDGDRHTAFGGENVCTDRAVIRYLIELTPPNPTRSCG